MTDQKNDIQVRMMMMWMIPNHPDIQPNFQVFFHFVCFNFFYSYFFGDKNKFRLVKKKYILGLFIAVWTPPPKPFSLPGQ